MYEFNQSLLFVFIVGFFYLSAEIGYRLGYRSRGPVHKESYPHVATIEGALLGLLALLLGFAFSLAMSRYDSRREVVVAEANDLQSTYLRATLMPEPFRDSAAKLLREYVDSRIEYLRAGASSELVKAALLRTEKIQEQLWSTAAAAVSSDSDEVRVGFFVESLNDLIDDHIRRIAAMDSHVPSIIIILLIFVGAMTVAMTGYSSGCNSQRLLVPRSILILLVAATLVVIVDLDRPRRGFITISEQAMLDLRGQINNTSN